jgi:uncharacterized membrane protein
MNEQGVGIADRIREVIEAAALGIEALAVAIILIAVIYGTIRYLIDQRTARSANAYSSYKVQLGRALLVGLELLVAADIVRTVALNPTLINVAILGFLVFIRTFLRWSLVVEIEGHWPWKAEREGKQTGAR